MLPRAKEMEFYGMEMVPEIETATSCYHCGENCDAELVKLEEKTFCCEGCKMVFEILQENDLCTYYDLENNPGLSLKGKRTTTYAYLEEKEVQEKLLTFSNGHLSKVSLHLPQIHCSSCIWLLENLYKLHPGITQSQVNFPKKTIYLTFEQEQTSLRKIVELLASIGYAPTINYSQLESKEQVNKDHSLTYKLGVTGFLFGNIMLISFPEYLGLQASVYATWFGYLNIAMALPLLLYSGSDYLRSAYYGLRQGHLNIDVPVSLGMLALFGRSLYEILSHTGAGYFDSLAGLIFFLLVGKWFQGKTYHNLSFERDYKSYFPIATLVKRKKDWVSTPLNKVEIGDQLLIKNGELIPADAKISKGVAHIDYSFVSGEEELITKRLGDRIFAGGKLQGGSIEVTVSRKVEHSYLTQLWNDQAFKKDKFEGKQSRLANQIAKFFTIVILSIAGLTFWYWWRIDSSIAFNAFTAVLIIACPCAVALAIPFTYGNVLRMLARHQFYVRHTQVIEALQSITHIVLDKTGTLTDNRQLSLQYEGDELPEAFKRAVKSMVVQSSHPLSVGIARLLSTSEILDQQVSVTEIPGKGLEAVIKGKTYRLGSAHFVGVEQNHRKGVFLQVEGEIKGLFTYKNQYRNTLDSFIADLRQLFKLSLLSGDNNQELEYLSPYFDADDQLHFNQSPQDKLTYIQSLQQEEAIVLMLGDGINDAGALQQSHVGVVLTEDINNFTPASDAILGAAQFGQFPALIRYIRQSKWVVYFAYAIAACYNVVGLSYAVQGLLSPVVAAILMPLSAITIVIIGVGGSWWLAQRNLGSVGDKNHQWV